MNHVANIGNRRELFVDKLLIDRMDNVRLQLHEPESGGAAIRIDRPWEGPANGPMVVFPYDGCFMMYYRAMTLEPSDDSGVLCVAFSDDGVTWTKPRFEEARNPGAAGDQYLHR